MSLIKINPNKMFVIIFLPTPSCNSASSILAVTEIVLVLLVVNCGGAIPIRATSNGEPHDLTDKPFQKNII
jgi:hypothetical protein